MGPEREADRQTMQTVRSGACARRPHAFARGQTKNEAEDGGESGGEGGASVRTSAGGACGGGRGWQWQTFHPMQERKPEMTEAGTKPIADAVFFVRPSR